MKRATLLCCAMSMLAAGPALADHHKKGQDEASASGPTLKTARQRQSYAIGMSMGRSLKRDNVDVDPALVAAGLEDVLAGSEPKLTQEEARQQIQKLRQKMQQQRQAESKKQKGQAKKNKKKAERFLKKNRKKEGVQVTDSGLQYKVIREGDGASPGKQDTVKTHYKGTLLDGTVFDSSYERGEPTTFPVNRVIPGWTEALQKMKVGSKWKLFIPPELAYGQRGAGQQIGPNEALIFEVELLGIEKRGGKNKGGSGSGGGQ